jgi:hypothetical protein
MKINILKISLFIFLGCFILIPESEAQLNEMGIILTGGVDDAEKLAGAYLSPFTDAFGANLNSGWFTTAKPHSVLGFDLTLSVNLGVIPTDAKSMNLNNLGLSANIIGGPETPTIAASKTDVPASLQYMESGNTLAEFELPKGTGLGFIPSPSLQLGIGLPMDTELIGRFVPEVKMGEAGSLGLWGIGIKHSLKQYIPGVKRLPFLNLSVMSGYTKFYSSAGLDFQPADIQAADQTSAAVNFTDQNLELAVSSFTANILVSADIPFFTAYCGLGINTTTSNLKMMGYFPVPELDGNQSVVTDSSALKDPVDVKFNGEGGKIQPRVTAGVKLKLAVIHLHGAYTYSNFSVVTGGIGISFR